MKKCKKYIFNSLVILSYLIGLVGFGIHECSTNGTKDLFLLIGNVSCSDIHSHTHNHPHHHNDLHHHCSCQSDAHHNGDCCHTYTYVLQQDQQSSDILAVEMPSAINLDLLGSNLTYGILFFDFDKVNFFSEAPPLIEEHTKAEFLSVFRI